MSHACATGLGEANLHLDRLYELATERWIPLHVMIELNHACHLSCVHCYIGDDPKEHLLRLDEVGRVMDELAAEGTLFLTLTGGEIFLRKDLFAIIRSARERGFVLTLFTSGTLITDKIADRLAEAYPHAVELSLYSMSPEVHDAITRKPGSHAKTLEAARLLRDRGIHVVVKSVIMTLNDDEYRGVSEFAKSIGAEQRFDPTVSPRRDGDALPLGYQIAAERRARLGRDPLLAQYVDPQQPPHPDTAPCGAGRWSCDISPSGEVYPCLAFPYGLSAGSLRSQSFSEIWHHSPMMRRARAVTVGDLDRAGAGCSHGGECARCMGFGLTLHGPGYLGLSRA